MSVRLGYKQTELGEIPEEWDIVSLANVTHRIIDIDHNMPQKTVEGVPFISIKYLLKNVNTIFELDKQDKDLEFISESDYAHYSKRFDAEYDDILYSRFGTIGNAKLIHATEKIIASYSIALIKPNKEIISPLFLAYLLNSAGAKRQAWAKTKGSTNQNLHLSDIKTIMLLRPPRSEQNAITTILATVDDSIQKSDQIFTKTQLLKTGLMRQLFTRGIGHTRFKQTELGEIPESWQVKEMGELVQLKNGINFDRNQKGSGILTVDVLNMYSDSIYLEMAHLYRVNKDMSAEYLLQPDDLLFVRSSLKQEGVGWPALFRGYSEPVAFCGFLIRARLLSAEICPSFLVNYLRLPATRELLISKSGKVAISNINQASLRSLPIPVPPVEEQQKIASILSNLDEKLKMEWNAKEQLTRLKKGLMSALLTGEVRVKVA